MIQIIQRSLIAAILNYYKTKVNVHLIKLNEIIKTRSIKALTGILTKAFVVLSVDQD